MTDLYYPALNHNEHPVMRKCTNGLNCDEQGKHFVKEADYLAATAERDLWKAEWKQISETARVLQEWKNAHVLVDLGTLDRPLTDSAGVPQK